MVANACPQTELLKGEAALQISVSRKKTLLLGWGLAADLPAKAVPRLGDCGFTSDTAWSALSFSEGLQSSENGGQVVWSTGTFLLHSPKGVKGTIKCGEPRALEDWCHRQGSATYTTAPASGKLGC